MIIDGFEDFASLLACLDASCRETTFMWAEPPDANTDPAPGAVSARLPDGRLLLTSWSHRALRLVTCDAGTCTPVHRSWNIARANYSAEYTGVALAVRRDGGPVVAFADKERVKGDDRPTKDIISLISCAEAACLRPRVTRPVPPYPPGVNDRLRRETGLALAVRKDGRPVIAYLDMNDDAAKTA